MQYEQPGIDASALCQLQMASGGAATVEIGWQHGDGAIAVYGSEGYLKVVLDEQVGYYGYPARAVREFSGGAPGSAPSKAHYLPPEFNMMEPQLYRDLVTTLEGGEQIYPAFGTTDAVRSRRRSPCTRQSAPELGRGAHPRGRSGLRARGRALV